MSEYLRYLVPGDVGITESTPEEVSVGENAEENAEILQRVFTGSDRARTDLIAINAGAGLLVSGNGDSGTRRRGAARARRKRRRLGNAAQHGALIGVEILAGRSGP